MNYLLSNITLFRFAAYLAAAMLMYLLFRFVERYMVPLLQKRIESINPLFAKLQIVAWLSFGVFLFASALAQFTLVTLIVTALILILGREYWKNIFAGTLIKFTNRLNEGDFISTDFIQGTIMKIFLSFTEIRNEKGESVIVPNTSLHDCVVTHPKRAHDPNICVFELRTKANLRLEHFYQLAYNCPYLSANQDISVEKTSPFEAVIKATIIDDSFKDRANRYFEMYIGDDI
ncbi:MAG: mechanosensitive ion channel [Pyrinomonadaceae bacterium]|nr:mechanosensitive ion channel [Pyrinomonadaceae bacterium]